jgi:hypothetical protein
MLITATSILSNSAGGLSDSAYLAITLVTLVFASITAPMLLSWRTQRQHIKDRDAEWARQDEKDKKAEKQRADDVARQNEVAREAADLLVASQEQSRHDLAQIAEDQAVRARDAALAADGVAAQAAEAASLLVESNERIASTAATTNGKLDVIHTLVNSNLTTEMQGRLEEMEARLALMREVVDLKRAAGKKPTVAVNAAIKATEAGIAGLQTELAERLQQNKVAEKQMKASPSSAVTRS